MLLQNRSTGHVVVAYLGGSNGTSVNNKTGESMVLSTHNPESSMFAGWTAAGMQHMNGDGPRIANAL